MARHKVDFRIVNHGTIYLIYPDTRRARQWVKEHLPQDHMKYADAAVVEHRYVGDIIDGIGADGLDIALSKAPLAS